MNVYLYKSGSVSALAHGRVDETDPVTLYDSNGVATTNGWDDLELVFWGGHEAVEVTDAQAAALVGAGYTVDGYGGGGDTDPGTPPPVTGDAHPGTDILAEDGSFILAEDGVSSIEAEG
jgi:hypothetical protein